MAKSPVVEVVNGGAPPAARGRAPAAAKGRLVPTSPRHRKPATGLQRQTVPPQGLNEAMSMFERLALDPKCDPLKLQQLIDAQLRIKDVNARDEFNRAFSEMQAELPLVVKRGKITYEKNNVLIEKGKYAKYEDIIEVIRPILSRHGFSIRHRCEYPTGLPDCPVPQGHILIRGILSHKAGHHEEDVFVAADDPSGNKNGIQAKGSTRAYGMRYTTKALTGIAEAGEDNDGKTTGKAAGGKVAGEQKAAPSAGADGKGDEPITDPQRKRLWTIAQKSGRSDTELKMWLAVMYKIDSSRKIPRRLYEEICSHIEAKGPLPQPREAGEEG